MRKRSAPCSATISMRLSIPPRRCAGPMPTPPPRIRRCPTVWSRSPITCGPRRNWRGAPRAAQHEADAARDRHTAPEREINRHAARRSALTEARSRLTADRSEAEAAHEDATAALAELPASLDTENKLAAVRAEIDNH